MIVEEVAAKFGLDVDEVGFSRAHSLLQTLKVGYLGFGAAIAGALAVGAAAIAKSTADAGDAAAKMAQKVGVDSEALQEFVYAGELADASAEDIQTAFGHLAKSGVKDVRAEFLRLAKQFQSMPDDGNKVALALDKFGRSGKQLIPMLNELNEATLLEAHTLGQVISKDDQKNAEEFNDELTRLEKTFSGLRNALGVKLLPALTKVITAFRTAVLVVGESGKALEYLITASKTIAALFLGRLLTSIAVSTAAIVAQGVAWLAAGNLSVAAAVKAVVAWGLAAAPVWALTLAFALLLLVIEDVYQFLNGGDSLLGELGPKWTSFLESFTAAKEEDPWWLTAMKAGLEAALDLEGTWERISAKGSRGEQLLRGLGTALSALGVPGAQAGVNPFASREIEASPAALSGMRARQETNAVLQRATSYTQAPMSFSIYAAPGMDEQAVAKAVAREVGTVMRDTAAAHQ